MLRQVSGTRISRLRVNRTPFVGSVAHATTPTAAGSIKRRDYVKIEGEVYDVLGCDHVKPGKGGAFAQMELLRLRNGARHKMRFRTQETMELVEPEPKVAYQILYREGGTVNAMHGETFEQISFPAKVLGDMDDLLPDGSSVELMLFEGEVIRVAQPNSVVRRVLEVRGDVAFVDGGARVSDVPASVTADSYVKIAVADKRIIGVVDSVEVEMLRNNGEIA